MSRDPSCINSDTDLTPRIAQADAHFPTAVSVKPKIVQLHAQKGSGIARLIGSDIVSHSHCSLHSRKKCCSLASCKISKELVRPISKKKWDHRRPFYAPPESIASLWFSTATAHLIYIFTIQFPFTVLKLTLIFWANLPSDRSLSLFLLLNIGCSASGLVHPSAQSTTCYLLWWWCWHVNRHNNFVRNTGTCVGNAMRIPVFS